MKVICISCFDYYETRIKSVIDIFRKKGWETTYITTDFQHYTKKRYKANYEKTIQIHVPEYDELDKKEYGFYFYYLFWSPKC